MDAEGHVLGGAASSRPRIVGKEVVETAWSGAFGEYRMFDHLRAPTTAEATWQRPKARSPTGEAVLRTLGLSDDAGPLVPLLAGAVKSDLAIETRME
jgi:hypothetical protein